MHCGNCGELLEEDGWGNLRHLQLLPFWFDSRYCVFTWCNGVLGLRYEPEYLVVLCDDPGCLDKEIAGLLRNE
jgi:hypothetical protein